MTGTKANEVKGVARKSHPITRGVIFLRFERVNIEKVKLGMIQKIALMRNLFCRKRGEYSENENSVTNCLF